MIRGVIASLALAAGLSLSESQRQRARHRRSAFACPRCHALPGREGRGGILLLEAKEERQMEAQVRRLGSVHRAANSSRCALDPQLEVRQCGAHRSSSRSPTRRASQSEKKLPSGTPPSSAARPREWERPLMPR